MTPFSICAWVAIVAGLWLDPWGTLMLPIVGAVAAAWGCGYIPASQVPTAVAALLTLRAALWFWDVCRG